MFRGSLRARINMIYHEYENKKQTARITKGRSSLFIQHRRKQGEMYLQLRLLLSRNAADLGSSEEEVWVLQTGAYRAAGNTP